MTDEVPPRRDTLGDLVEAVVARFEPIELRQTLVGRILLAVPAGLAAVGLAAITPPLAAVAAVGYAGAWVAIARRRIWIDHEGVRWRGLVDGALRWDEIESYRYWSASMRTLRPALGERVVDAAAAGVATTRHHLELICRGRARVTITSNYQGAQRAVGRVLAEIHPRLRARGPLDLAPFAIGDDGLIHAQHGTLPWRDLEKVVLTAELPPRVRVMKRGKAFAWASESMRGITNSMLLLEELAERGVPVDPGARALITAPMLAALDRSRALPQATARFKDPA